MQITNMLSVMKVRDHEAAVDWYVGLSGRGSDRRPVPRSAEWDLGSGRGSHPSGQFRLAMLPDTSRNAVVHAHEEQPEPAPA